jgi:hypothetical protein
MPEPMQELGPDFVAVGSGLGATGSTTVRDGCTVFPVSSSAFAAALLSGSGALPLKLLNMLASPCGLHVGAMREQPARRLSTKHQRYHARMSANSSTSDF